MAARYAYVGDDPAAIAAAATVLEHRASDLAANASSASGELPRLREAWTVGSAGDRAYAVATRLSAHLDTIAPGLRAGSDARTGSSRRWSRWCGPSATGSTTAVARHTTAR